MNEKNTVNYVFWVLPNLLGGRPGPNLQPWDERALHDGGIRAILSVNSGDDVSATRLKAAGIDYRCIPLTADAPPLPGDDTMCLKRLPEQFDFVHEHVARGEPTLIHCRHGKDRTGLFLAYYLARTEKLKPHHAIRRLKEHRPIALSAVGWEDLAMEVLRRV